MCEYLEFEYFEFEHFKCLFFLVLGSALLLYGKHFQILLYVSWSFYTIYFSLFSHLLCFQCGVCADEYVATEVGH